MMDKIHVFASPRLTNPTDSSWSCVPLDVGMPYIVRGSCALGSRDSIPSPPRPEQVVCVRVCMYVSVCECVCFSPRLAIFQLRQRRASHSQYTPLFHLNFLPSKRYKKSMTKQLHLCQPFSRCTTTILFHEHAVQNSSTFSKSSSQST